MSNTHPQVLFLTRQPLQHLPNYPRLPNYRPRTPIATNTGHFLEMNSDTTESATFEVQEKHLEVPMSGDDYEVCTKLLRRLLCAELIHAYWWHEETSTTYIHYSAKVDHEGLPNDESTTIRSEG
jgi:hypothetical protein